MPAIAFLFDGTDLDFSDCDLAYRVIFSEVLKRARRSHLHLREGAILLSRFSYRTSAVESSNKGKRPSVSHTERDDKELRMTLAVAFASSAASKFYMLDADKLARTLLTVPVECTRVVFAKLLTAAFTRPLASRRATNDSAQPHGQDIWHYRCHIYCTIGSLVLVACDKGRYHTLISSTGICKFRR